MSLKKAMDNLKFDTRMIEINYKAQALTKNEYQEKLSQLKDVRENSIILDLESGDDSDSLGSGDDQSY